ncbi:endo-glucanase 2 family protein [Hibiscus syriacus]|uniref:Endo-glucanase 2 family protein n=1 Tax=Hibiscus syriacus TaxID=106335 RepID=A0A6A2ZRW8_HIBSY|nr:endo-glucanase 2 family protein [Hibiscus syriacus]
MLRALGSVLLCCFLLEASIWITISYGESITCSGIVPMSYRNETISITDFGGVDDGKTLNTKAFRKAIYRIQHLRRRGGTLLYVPSGVYLTDSLNLTRHMTLYLAQGAVIRATQHFYKFESFKNFTTLLSSRCGEGSTPEEDILALFMVMDCKMCTVRMAQLMVKEISGGTCGGRGLQFTRPNLVEFVNSNGILISNLIFRDSPFRNIHPVYCSYVVILNITILASPDSPNTDGIDPCKKIMETLQCLYRRNTSDHLVAVKSGWDEYGIAYGRPSSYITIRRVRGTTPFAGIAVGSETSGGVENVLAENIVLYNTGVGVNIKTIIGRGGFIKNITVSQVFMENVRPGIKVAGDTSYHPDNNFNPNALPYVNGVILKNIWGVEVQRAGSMQGLKDAPFTGICLSNVSLQARSNAFMEML